MLKITFLGTGPSLGVPVVGCACDVCASNEPKNKRLRTSILINIGEKAMVIDTGPDFRTQALRANLKTLDAILITHAHADHILGLDDVRIFNFREKKSIPVYASKEAFDDIRKTFWYAFDESNAYPWKPKIVPNIITPETPFTVCGVGVMPIALEHGTMTSIGYKIGNFAYLTDILKVPESAEKILRGVDTFVISALRLEKHSTHICLDEAVAIVKQFAPRVAYLTHLGHELDFEKISSRLPSPIHLAYDGLEITVR